MKFMLRVPYTALVFICMILNWSFLNKGDGHGKVSRNYDVGVLEAVLDVR